MTLHQSTLCHVLQEHGDSGPCFVRHPQFFVDVSGAQSILRFASSAIVHRENRQDRPLVGVSKGTGIGESGAEHCSLVVNFSQYRDNSDRIKRIVPVPQLSHCGKDFPFPVQRSLFCYYFPLQSSTLYCMQSTALLWCSYQRHQQMQSPRR